MNIHLYYITKFKEGGAFKNSAVGTLLIFYFIICFIKFTLKKIPNKIHK